MTNCNYITPVQVTLLHISVPFYCIPDITDCIILYPTLVYTSTQLCITVFVPHIMTLDLALLTVTITFYTSLNPMQYVHVLSEAVV